MSQPTDPDEWWANRGKRNTELNGIAPDNRKRLGLEGEYQRLQRECRMGLFVRGQSPELRLKREQQLNEYDAAVTRGERPTPPWQKPSLVEYNG